MTSDKTKKALTAGWLQGLLVSVIYRSRPLATVASNNNHDRNDADLSRQPKIRVMEGLGHGNHVLLLDLTLRLEWGTVNGLPNAREGRPLRRHLRTIPINRYIAKLPGHGSGL